ncbi:hypothetical protein WJX73_005657 [Symbiochloris irregularis]|uniref:Dienelactone hydrolase domain-containing protein n=1 Tax=Symbiochloris irregularis TaxID=706552 RepID=A0AAW1Q0F7_9CHLO
MAVQDMHKSRAADARAGRRGVQTEMATVEGSGICGPKGKDWSGTPHGKEIKFAGLDTYVTGRTEKPSAVILVIHDIWTWKLKNIRLLSDKLGAEGYLVLLPDFFHGDAIIDFGERAEFYARHPFTSTYPEVDAVLEQIKETYGNIPVGVEGFCYGGHFAIRLAGRTEGLSIKAAVIPHGSYIEPEIVEAAKQPVKFLFSNDEDHQIPKEKREKLEKILDSKLNSGYKFYADMEHGWSLRGDQSDKNIAAGAQDAYEQALAFFKEHVPLD